MNVQNNKKYFDRFNVDATILKSKKLFLFDMDGTIYEEDRIFDGTLNLLKEINHIGGDYIFITNNSSKSVKDYMNKLESMDINVNENNFYTSVHATIEYLKKNYTNKKVYCMGTKSLVEELKESKINVTTEVDESAEVILIGFDTELTFEKIRKTCEMLKRDLPYIATNPDYACPVSFGFVPDCGAICEMLYHSCGKRPRFIGKPNPVMVDSVIEKFNLKKEDVVVIGDRLYTDIATGNNAGVTSVCVLSGEAKIKDIIASDIKPTFTFDDVKEIYRCLKEI